MCGLATGLEGAAGATEAAVKAGQAALKAKGLIADIDRTFFTADELAAFKRANAKTGGVGDVIPPESAAEILKILSKNTTSGAELVPVAEKTTTVLGNYTKDMKNIITLLDTPKSLDFEAKPGGFNILNAPDDLYKTPDQFWREYNVPFLDKAIQRGDNILLATKPDPVWTTNPRSIAESTSGFEREYSYLRQKGYHYDDATKMMVKK